MKICWVKILTAVAGGSTGAYVVSPPLLIYAQQRLPGNRNCHTQARYLQHNKHLHTYILASSCTSLEPFSPSYSCLFLVLSVFPNIAHLRCGVNPGQNPLIRLHAWSLIQFVVPRVDSANAHSNPVQSNPD